MHLGVGWGEVVSHHNRLLINYECANLEEYAVFSSMKFINVVNLTALQARNTCTLYCPSKLEKARFDL